MSDQSELLQRALTAIDDLSARLERSEARTREPIAVVGMACRFPGGADTPEAYWDLLREGRSGIVEVPSDRWDIDEWYDPELSEAGTMYTRSGGFIGPVDRFDAGLFRISPREAATMDPQQRLLLECTWEALENAGIAPDSLGRSETGVFVGITSSDYARLMRIGREDSDVYSATGTALNAAAGRLAFVLGLQGPCMAIDTACSSSLVAAHVASQSLRAGECDAALVGGVNVMLAPENFALFSKWGMISRSGECRAFDDDASGFVRGEGCGMLVLKRHADALRDGDRILATIRGSAVNQDGPSSGLSVPNGPAQVKVIRAALERAGVEPREVGFVEAHGTGTPLGDPIEVEALGEVYSAGRTYEDPLLLGSVKPSIGHLESAAGTAGLIKLILTLRHGEIPPQRCFERPNTRIDWDRMPLRVVDRLLDWPGPADGPRLGAVSSFGFSGTNVHMVVEGAPVEATSPGEVRPRLLPLSARSETALRASADALADRFGAADAPTPADAARTLATGRATLPHRAAVVGDTAERLASGLRSLAQGHPSAGVVEGSFEGTAAPPVAFLYSGQGSQYPGMGMALRDAEPAFRDAFDRCARAVLDAGGPDLLDTLSGGDAEAIHRTAVTQPALFALEYAMTELLGTWGVRPSAVLGHSIGEVVAACVAGGMSLEDATRLVVERGRLMQELPAGGGMMAVECSPEVALEVSEPFRARVSLAGRNGPDSVVLSGALEALSEIAETLDARQIRSRPLTVSHAFHSPLMEPMQAAFGTTLAQLELRPPRLPLVSNLTATIDPRAGASTEYWVRHIREAVAFEPSMRTLVAEGYRVFLEIGPRPVLTGMATRFLDLPDGTWATTLRGRESEAADLLEGVGRLFTAGVRVDWDALLAGEGAPTTLPTYPFQRERHWAASAPTRARAEGGGGASGGFGGGTASSHPLLGVPLPSPLPTVQIPCDLDTERHPLLSEHRVAGLTVFPASGYVELARAAREVLEGDGSVRIEGGRFEAALILPSESSEAGAREITLTLDPDGAGEASFAVHGRGSAAGDGWTRHAIARIGPPTATPAPDASESNEAVGEGRGTEMEAVDIEAYQARLVALGLEYGPEFRTLVEARRRAGEAAGTVRLPGSDLGAGLGVHPGLLDAAFHLIGLAADDPTSDEERFLLPTAFDAITVHTSPGPEVSVHCRIVDEGAARVVADLVLRRPEGTVAVTIEGLETRRVGREQFRSALGIDAPGHLLALDWEPVDAPAGSTPGRWGVIAEDDALGTSLVAALADHGVEAHLIPDVAEVLDPDSGDLTGVVDLRALSAASDVARPPSAEVSEGPTGRGLELLAALARAGGELAVVLVTRNAQQLDAAESVDPTAAVLWGVGATADAELANTPVSLVDLADPETDLAALAGVIAGGGTERRLAVRGGALHAARLVRISDRDPDLPPAPRTVEIHRRGSLEGLEIRGMERVAPGPGEVEIEVLASGLNFRDVLNLLDMYPGEPGPPGNECAGRVVAVGEGVESVRPGDLVTCIAERTFSSHVVAGASMVFPLPPQLSVAQAAVFPIAQLTAWLGLHRLGRIAEGDRVLVHAGAGGVGLAAVHVALAAGAEVIATAGSEEKREFLRREGVAHVFDSRTTLRAETLLEATDGHGVDVVLNSLTGEAIDEGLRALAPGGRFIEIGLRDLRTAEEVAAIRDDVTYAAMILGDWCREDPEAVRKMWDELAALLAAGRIPPPRVRRFPLHRVGDAFAFMARARHIGRIAVTHPANASAWVRDDGAILITGGLGALGLHMAEGLADRGARALALMSRSAPSEAAAARIAALRERGVDVRVVAGDVTRAEDVRRVTTPDLPPLRGVVHAAGVAHDASLARHDTDRLRRVLAPKADGIEEVLRALDEAGLDPDFLLLFSSGSALLGSPGQAAYAGANAYLDAVARRLHAEGRSATSIGWGAWEGDGMAAGVDERTARRWADRGIRSFTPHEALSTLDDAVASGLPWLAALPMDWPRFFASLDHLPPLLSRLSAGPGRGRGATAGADAPGVAEAFVDELDPLPPLQRSRMLRGRLAAEVAAVLGMADPAELEPKRGFAEQGMDSLMAVELAGRIGALCAIDLPSTFLFDQPTLDALTTFLLEELERDGRIGASAVRGAAAEESAEEPVDAMAAELEGMSEEELAAELDRELGAARGEGGA